MAGDPWWIRRPSRRPRNRSPRSWSASATCTYARVASVSWQFPTAGRRHPRCAPCCWCGPCSRSPSAGASGCRHLPWPPWGHFSARSLRAGLAWRRAWEPTPGLAGCGVPEEKKYSPHNYWLVCSYKPISTPYCTCTMISDCKSLSFGVIQEIGDKAHTGSVGLKILNKSHVCPYTTENPILRLAFLLCDLLNTFIDHTAPAYLPTSRLLKGICNQKAVCICSRFCESTMKITRQKSLSQDNTFRCVWTNANYA